MGCGLVGGAGRRFVPQHASLEIDDSCHSTTGVPRRAYDWLVGFWSSKTVRTTEIKLKQNGQFNVVMSSIFANLQQPCSVFKSYFFPTARYSYSEQSTQAPPTNHRHAFRDTNRQLGTWLMLTIRTL